jgi:preprotein translocase subunit SecF
MTTNPHKFRYLLPPGSNFSFMSRTKLFMALTVLMVIATVGMLAYNKSARGGYMNWTIDFKGGTEIIYSFKQDGAPTKVDSNTVRNALKDAGEEGFDVSETSWEVEEGGKDVTINGMMIRTPRFSAMKPEQAQLALDEFLKLAADREVEKAAWSGERLFVRSKKSLVGLDATAAFTAGGLVVKPWVDAQEIERFAHADEGTGEYRAEYTIRGIDHQLEQVLEKAVPGVDATAVQSYGVGAKAGAELRNDAIKAVIYALFLVVLYLAFRFDIRYAPGAIFATIHDVIAVVLVFAITWTEVSLTTVAAILTVIGFSVNDTVVIFDRIRENQAKLKDKKLERIVDISLNETLVRSILTSVTVFAITLIMNIFGEGLVRNFAFAMNVGVVVGTYSSLFLAPPVFMWIARKFYSGPARQRVYKTSAVQAEE